jgi:hypothetical protein
MIRAKDLTEVEKTELGLARNEVQTQVQSSSHRGSRGGGSG